MQRKNEELQIEEYWWVILILWLLNWVKNGIEAEKPNLKRKPLETAQTDVKTHVLEKNVYVDVEAVERANDVAVNLDDLNEKVTKSVAVYTRPEQPHYRGGAGGKELTMLLPEYLDVEQTLF